jgi:hypothetical protein
MAIPKLAMHPYLIFSAFKMDNIVTSFLDFFCVSFKLYSYKLT